MRCFFLGVVIGFVVVVIGINLVMVDEFMVVDIEVEGL